MTLCTLYTLHEPSSGVAFGSIEGFSPVGGQQGADYKGSCSRHMKNRSYDCLVPFDALWTVDTSSFILFEYTSTRALGAELQGSSLLPMDPWIKAFAGKISPLIKIHPVLLEPCPSLHSYSRSDPTLMESSSSKCNLSVSAYPWLWLHCMFQDLIPM